MTISLTKFEEKLRSLDIEGFIQLGAPEDEYNLEAKEIFMALKNQNLKREFVDSLVTTIWSRHFNLDKDDIDKRKGQLSELVDFIVEF